MHEQEPGLDLVLLPLAIDGGRDLVLHKLLLIPSPVGLAAPGALTLSRADSVNQAIFQSNPLAHQTYTLAIQSKANLSIALLLAAKCN